MNLPDSCPNCNVTWIGAPIPLQDRHLFGATHFRRQIAQYDRRLDCTVGWECPDCQYLIHRPQAEIDLVKDPHP